MREVQRLPPSPKAARKGQSQALPTLGTELSTPLSDSSLCAKRKKKNILVTQFTKGRGFSNILTSPVEVFAFSGSRATPCPLITDLFSITCSLLSSWVLQLQAIYLSLFFLMVSLTQGFSNETNWRAWASSRARVCSREGVQGGAKRSPPKKTCTDWSPNSRTWELYILRCSTCPFEEKGILVPKI